MKSILIFGILIITTVFCENILGQNQNKKNLSARENKVNKNNKLVDNVITSIKLTKTASNNSNLLCPDFNDTISYVSNMICEGGTTILTAPRGFESFIWSDGSTSENDTVGVGTYWVKVKSTNNCVYTTASVTVSQYVSVKPGILPSGPTTFCEGDSVILSVSGGNISSLQWSNGSSSTYIIVKNSGNFTVTTTHAVHGCTSTSDTTKVVVNQPTFSDTTVVSCNTYTWNNVVYTASGVYTYNTTNVNGCDSTATLHLSLMSLSSTYTKTDATCNGSYTGSITVIPTSGVGPYLYRIGTYGSYVTNSTFNNLRSGKYRISIIDNNGCSGTTAQIVIGQNAPITGNATHQDPICYGSSTGSITVKPSSGIPPFSYRLGSSGVFGSANSFFNLRAGTYRVTILDGGGCQGNVTNIVLTDPQPILASFDITHVKCHGTKTGEIAAIPSDGTPPYSFKLGTAGTYGPSSVFTGLGAGSYLIYIRDDNGCVMVSRQVVLQPEPIILSITKTDESCPDAKDGSITAIGGNGAAPYLYKFGTSGTFNTNNVFSNLKAGSYRIYVNDANNCVGPSVGVQIVTLAPFCFSSPALTNGEYAPSKDNRISLESSVYPNPSTSGFTLRVPTNSNNPIQVRITDLNGKNLLTYKGAANQLLKFGEHFSTGVYMVEIIQGDNKKTLKAIKIK